MNENGITIECVRHGDHYWCTFSIDDADVRHETFSENCAHGVEFRTSSLWMTTNLSHDVPRLGDG